MRFFIAPFLAMLAIASHAQSQRLDAGPAVNWNEPLYADTSGTRVNSGAGVVFLASGPKLYLKQQLETCSDLGLSTGDSLQKKRCDDRVINAYKFLRAKAYESKLPLPVWQLCGRRWTGDMDLGARCIAAAGDICQIDEGGMLIDRESCIRIMGGSTWVMNPAAQALNFSSK